MKAADVNWPQLARRKVGDGHVIQVEPNCNQISNCDPSHGSILWSLAARHIDKKHAHCLDGAVEIFLPPLRVQALSRAYIACQL